MHTYGEEKENDWSIYPIRPRFRRSETGLAADRAASEALQTKESERLRAKRVQILSKPVAHVLGSLRHRLPIQAWSLLRFISSVLLSLCNYDILRRTFSPETFLLEE
jgi:hypothetical protein